MITPPYDEKLNIGVLSRIFDRNRITNSYKYFWFMAILKKVSNGQSEFTYDELVDQMVVDAWYMVTEYNLRLCRNDETARTAYNECLEYHVNSDAVRRNLYADDLDETGFENALREIVKPVYDSAKMCGFSEWEYSAAI